VKKLLPIILVLLGVAGGGAAGFFLKPAPPPPEETDAEMAEGSAEAMEKEAEPEPEPADVALDENGNPVEQFEYVRLKNQFVVPIVDGEAVKSLVVVSISLEMHLGYSDVVHTREPKLRDLFLRALFKQAQSGAFTGVFTASHFMTDLRKNLYFAARQVLGETVNDVLITEIVRKDV
jgi:hypothetical protein